MERSGKKLKTEIYISGENLEKVDLILDYLNSLPDVQNGDAQPWDYSAVYDMLINRAIEHFKIPGK